mgnify:CR=1 FL=1
MTTEEKLLLAEALLRDCLRACNMIPCEKYHTLEGDNMDTYRLASHIDQYFRETTDA